MSQQKDKWEWLVSVVLHKNMIYRKNRLRWSKLAYELGNINCLKLFNAHITCSFPLASQHTYDRYVRYVLMIYACMITTCTLHAHPLTPEGIEDYGNPSAHTIYRRYTSIHLFRNIIHTYACLHCVDDLPTLSVHMIPIFISSYPLTAWTNGPLACVRACISKACAFSS